MLLLEMLKLPRGLDGVVFPPFNLIYSSRFYKTIDRTDLCKNSQLHPNSHAPDSFKKIKKIVKHYEKIWKK